MTGNLIFILLEASQELAGFYFFKYSVASLRSPYSKQTSEFRLCSCVLTTGLSHRVCLKDSEVD
jgi:hypothetical protein